MAPQQVEVKITADTPAIKRYVQDVLLEALRGLAGKAYAVQQKQAGGCACPAESQRQCGYGVGTQAVVDLIHNAIAGLESGDSTDDGEG